VVVPLRTRSVGSWWTPMVCWFRPRSGGPEGGPLAQPGEPVGAAVVVGVGGQDRFAQRGREEGLVSGDPRPDVVEAVVALRGEEEQPEGQDPARAEGPFPRGRGVAVGGGDRVQGLQGGPQDGQAGNGFDTQQAGFAGIHPASLGVTGFTENHPQHKRTVGLGGQIMRPGAYTPDPTAGITRVEDLPAPLPERRSHNYRQRPCPRCGRSCPRHSSGHRTLHDVGSPRQDRPRQVCAAY
jgi:hypothetical protein